MRAMSARRPPNGRDGSRCRQSRGHWKRKPRTSSTCLGQTLADQYPGLLSGTRPVDIYTTLDFEPAADRAGSGAGRRRGDRRPARAQADQGPGPDRPDCHRPEDRRHRGLHRRPLIRAVPVQPPRERPAPARVGVQAVRLPGRVRIGGRRRAGPTSRPPRSSTTSRRRSPSTIRQWTPRNYEDEYDGIITLRRALAQSRNVGHGAGGRDWSASTRSPGCGSGSGRARCPSRIRRSPSACSRPRRSKWLRPTRCSRTAAKHARCAPSPGSKAAAPNCRCKAAPPVRIARAGHHVSRHEHDAERHQRGDRGVGPRHGLQP